jgi:intracellular multiplication protein IcmV
MAKSNKSKKAKSSQKNKESRTFFQFMASNFFNLSEWISLDIIRNMHKFFWQEGKTVLRPDTTSPQQKEEFSIAMTRHEVDEGQLLGRIRFHTRLAYFFCTLAIVGLAYTLYFLVRSYYYACMLAFAASAVALARAFQSHFWVFQMRERKLGCTLEDWKQGKVGSHDES